MNELLRKLKWGFCLKLKNSSIILTLNQTVWSGFVLCVHEQNIFNGNIFNPNFL